MACNANHFVSFSHDGEALDLHYLPPIPAFERTVFSRRSTALRIAAGVLTRNL